MQWLKFNLSLLFIFSLSIQAFDGVGCFDQNFDITINHKGWPLGLVKNSLSIRKVKCDIHVSHTRLKYLNSTWYVDVCREPVHIKKGSGAVEVIKRQGKCGNASDSIFCSERKKIVEIIQDSGLIFAEGVKEDLASDHGKAYCAYKLLKWYMDGQVMGPDNIKDVIFHKGSYSEYKKSYENEKAPRPTINTSDLNVKEEEESVKESDGPAARPTLEKSF